VGNPKGSRYENELLKYLRSQDLDAERLRLTGKEDEGDLLVRHTGERRFVLEAKNTKRMTLAGWVEEARLEARQYGEHRGIATPYFAVVHKRVGKGTDQSFVTLPLHEYLEQIR
jgi:Holliday junction resolvase